MEKLKSLLALLYHCGFKVVLKFPFGSDSRKKCCPGWSSKYSATFVLNHLGYKHFLSRKYYKTFTRERKLCELFFQTGLPFFSSI